MKVIVTAHAKQRFMERTKVPYTQFQQTAEKAWNSGKKMEKFSGAFFDFLDSKSINGSKYKIKVLDDLIFVFEACTQERNKIRLITVYNVPEDFQKEQEQEQEHRHCIIVVNDLFVSIDNDLTQDIGYAREFKSYQKARNYIKNNRWLGEMYENIDYLYI